MEIIKKYLVDLSGSFVVFLCFFCTNLTNEKLIFARVETGIGMERFVNEGNRFMTDDSVKNDTRTNASLFTEDLLLKDFNNNLVNLKFLEFDKDTLVLFVWCKTCGPCIKLLNQLRDNKAHKKFQVLAVAIVKDDSIKREKEIIEKNNWPFQLYYDDEQNLGKFMGDRGYYVNPFTNNKIHSFSAFPAVFMFVKGELMCFGCREFLNNQ